MRSILRALLLLSATLSGTALAQTASRDISGATIQAAAARPAERLQVEHGTCQSQGWRGLMPTCCATREVGAPATPKPADIRRGRTAPAASFPAPSTGPTYSGRLYQLHQNGNLARDRHCLRQRLPRLANARQQSGDQGDLRRRRRALPVAQYGQDLALSTGAPCSGSCPGWRDARQQSGDHDGHGGRQRALSVAQHGQDLALYEHAVQRRQLPRLADARQQSGDHGNCGRRQRALPVAQHGQDLAPYGHAVQR